MGAIHFPGSEVLAKRLSSHKLFNGRYLREKRITKAVVKLAIKIFANHTYTKEELWERVIRMFRDSETELSELPDALKQTLAISLERALIECAGKAAKL